MAKLLVLAACTSALLQQPARRISLTPRMGVRLVRLAGCCSRALVQAARTRSFAILCNLVINACLDRCVTDLDCSSVAFWLIAVQCDVVTSLSDSLGESSPRPASPSVAEGAVGCKTLSQMTTGPESQGLHRAGFGNRSTPSLRQQQQFCTAEVIAAIVSIDERSSAS